jgi:hypothetical protein
MELYLNTSTFLLISNRGHPALSVRPIDVEPKDLKPKLSVKG